MSLARSKRLDRKFWLGTAIVVAAISAVAFALARNLPGDEIDYKTEIVSRASLSAAVDATGTVRARQAVVLNWQTDGRVESVDAQIGDSVTAGQVLASLSRASLPQNIILGEAELVSAQQELETTLESNLALAQAQQALAQAQEAAKRAQQDYDRLNRPRVSDELIEQTEDEIRAAQDQLERVQEIYDRFFKYNALADGSRTKAELTLNLLNIQQNIDTLVARYNWYTSQPSAVDVAQAKANLALALARQEDAQRELDRLADGKNTDAIASAQARVNAALSTINQGKIIAPFNGTITEALPIPGDLVSSGGTAFRVEDLDHLYLDIEISEMDINAIQVGQTVELIFDANPDQAYSGTVIEVSLAGNVSGSGVIFPVTVEMTDVDESIKPGMTAAVTIVVRDVESALLVPNRAVRFVNGKRFVYVLRNGEAVQIEVQLGTVADFYSEVIGGELKEGDTLILNPPARE
jgi:HlyD family secretion protein